MIMTETDAKEHICPLGNSGQMCAGAACMAWRWATEKALISGMDGNPERLIDRPAYLRQPCEGCHGTGFVDCEACPECGGDGEGARGGRLGYCGLAGRPELNM